MGTPNFAAQILAALLEAGHDLAAVYCQPARAAGRGQKPRSSPVEIFAENHSLPVWTPERLRNPEIQAAFADLELDAAVVAAYGLILPKSMLDAPRLGCINVHASLLPRWRGAAPIQRAILAGDAETGVTIMQMDEGLDTGPSILAESVAITAQTTASTLHDELAASGARLIVEALTGLANGSLKPQPQSAEGVTVAPKIERTEGQMRWGDAAVDLERKVRAFTPWPGAWFEHGGERIKVLSAELADGNAPSGIVLDNALRIACGRGALRLNRVQRAGKAPMDAAEFLRGYALSKGTLLP